jgi:hypothetical protein
VVARLESPAVTRATALLFAVLVVIFAVVAVENRGAFSAKPATAPSSDFSAERARTAFRTILGGNIPHPVGSAAHDAVRDRLAAHLQSLGYDVTLQRAFACTANVVCAPVVNVIARTPGDTNRPDALLIVAHYDSVPAGPGASDDGEGVATIVETARALRGEHFRSPIVFLITDAEEAGLIGAEAFVADQRLLKSVAAVINIEARGTKGSSYMFETSARNQWMIRIMAHALPRPSTTSLFASIYDMLPNDTDLTVFKRAGLASINFANIGVVARYHTPLDSLENVSILTLQHHGDHALAMARALAGADLRQTSDANAVWFDVLGAFIIWWPLRWSLWMAIVALVILLVVVVLRFFDREMPGGGATLGVVAFFSSIILTFVLAFAASWLTGMRAHHASFVANPGPAIAAMWLIGFGIPIAMSRRLHDSAKFDGLYLGQGISWCALAITLSILMPGASYLAVVPAMAAAVLAVARTTIGANIAIISILNAVVAATLLFPLAFSIYDALGGPALPVVAAVVALVTTTFAPMIVTAPPLRQALVSAFLITAIVFIGIANLGQPYTADSPRHINVRYYEDGKPQWLTDTVTPAMARAANFAPARQKMFEWLATPSQAYVAAAPPLGAPAPEVHVVSDQRGNGTRHLTLQVRSARNANGRLALLFRTDALQSIRVNGVAPPPAPQRFRNFFAPDWHQATVRGASEAVVEIALSKDVAIDAAVIDTSYGLPPAGAALARARDASTAVPVHDGDSVTVVRRLRI